MGSPVGGTPLDAAGVSSLIRQVFAETLELQLPEDELAGIHQLSEAVAMDSVAALQFVVALEQRFSIRLDEDWLDLDRLSDIEALTAYISGRLASGGTAG
ncbi:MAG TPA: acyl carrier protein [Bryobacteraceae bacterium]|nr:acyl carrier protein [Bryobacteraceae bacterium]